MLDALTFFAILGVAGLAVLGIREHGKLRQSRRALLDFCADSLEQPVVSHGDDDFPLLEGRHRGRPVVAELIPDSMTIRRLPQLWLRVTRLEPRPSIEEFAVLVRPAGTEFYSLTSDLRCHLRPPPALQQQEVLICGGTPAAQRLLDDMSNVIGRILSDPKIKELAVTRKGLRIIWQAGEGRRGEHLLLRQCVYDDAHVAAVSLERLLADLDEVSRALSPANGSKVVAA